MESKATAVIAGKTTTQDSPKETASRNEVSNAPHKGISDRQEILDDYYCDALNEHNVNKIADGSKLNIVAIVGFADYGKTTFVSSLYHQFLTNVEFSNHTMYDSDTFIGFERRFLIRSIQTPMEETGKRTIKGEDSLLALSLDSKENGRYKLILSDKSGEDYADFTGAEEEIGDYIILSLAHHILFFIDTDKLLNSMASVKYSYNGLINDLIDHDMIPDRCRLSVVFNKCDMVKDEQKELYEENKKKMMEFFEGVFKSAKVFPYEIDSTGASDSFASFKKLCDDLLSIENLTDKPNSEDLDWVKKELNDNQ